MPRILQITDQHIMAATGATLLGVDTEYYFRQTLAHAHARHGPFDLLLLTGDLAQEPGPASYRRILDILAEYPTPCLCLPGNHDDPELMQRLLVTDRVSCRKHLQLANWQIVCLDSSLAHSPAGELADTELAFLQQCLRTAADTPSLIALHHHCVPSGSPWLDTMQIRNSDALLAILAGHANARLLVCGHVHQAFDTAHGRIGIHATPSTCFQFQRQTRELTISTERPGYRLIDLAADGSYATRCWRIAEDLTGLDRQTGAY